MSRQKSEMIIAQEMAKCLKAFMTRKSTEVCDNSDKLFFFFFFFFLIKIISLLPAFIYPYILPVCAFYNLFVAVMLVD